MLILDKAQEQAGQSAGAHRTRTETDKMTQQDSKFSKISTNEKKEMANGVISRMAIVMFITSMALLAYSFISERLMPSAVGGGVSAVVGVVLIALVCIEFAVIVAGGVWRVSLSLADRRLDSKAKRY